MSESFTSGSVGGLGEQSPGSTRPVAAVPVDLVTNIVIGSVEVVRPKMPSGDSLCRRV